MEVSGDIDVLFFAEAFAYSGGESFCSGHPDGAEGDFDRGQRGSGPGLLDTIESGDGDVPGNFESALLEVVDEVVGLVVGCTHPGGHSLAGTFGGFFDSLGDIGESSGINADGVLLSYLEFQAGHFFKEGTVASEGPTGVDSIGPGVKPDSFVTLLDKMVYDGGDAIEVVDVDTVDAVLLNLIDQGDKRKAHRKFVDNGGRKRVDEEDSPGLAVLEAFDFFESRIVDSGDIGWDEMHIDLGVVELGILRDSGQDLLSGAFVVLAKILVGIGADQD